ncbi:MAG: hypothetical protein MZU84_04785 [Sphingobacterium sp.]|nr:hypothetical protein [Sphingobacterium sp.]
MADIEGVKETKNYYPEVPASHEGFHLKGAHQLDWGMRNRLSKIFRPSTGRTVMLAVDHGYFLGPTTGLERIDLTIVPLLAYADALMCTRGILRSSIPSTFDERRRACGRAAGPARSRSCRTSSSPSTSTTRCA